MRRRTVLKGILSAVVGVGAVAYATPEHHGLAVAPAHASDGAKFGSLSARVSTTRTVQIPPPPGSTIGTTAAQLAFGPGGAYFIFGDSLAFYNATSRTTSRIPLAHTGKTYDAYLNLTYNPVTRRLISVHNVDGNYFVQTINPASGAILTSIPLPLGFSGEAVGVSPLTGKIFVAIENPGLPAVRALLTIKSDGEATVSGVQVDEGIRQVAVNPKNGHVTGFVPVTGANKGLVIAINPETGVVKHMTTGDFTYGGAALDPVRQRALLPTVNDQGMSVVVVVPLDGSAPSNIPVGTSLQVATNLTTGQAYVMSDGNVYEFNPQLAGAAALTAVTLPSRSPQSYTLAGFLVDEFSGVAYVRGYMSGQLVLDELPP